MNEETPFLSNAFQLITMSTRFLNCWSGIKKIHTKGCAWRKHQPLTLPEETAAHIPYPSRILPRKYLLPSTDALELQGEAEWETIQAKPKVCRASRASRPRKNATTQALGVPLRAGRGARPPPSATVRLVGLQKHSVTGLEAEPTESTLLRGTRGARLAPHGDATGWAEKI